MGRLALADVVPEQAADWLGNVAPGGCPEGSEIEANRPIGHGAERGQAVAVRDFDAHRQVSVHETLLEKGGERTRTTVRPPDPLQDWA
jgi:hypothetical protein